MLVRGDIAYGNEEMMTGCEQRDLAYVFKLRQAGPSTEQGEMAQCRTGMGRGGKRVTVTGLDLCAQGDRVAAQPTLPGLTLEHRGGDWYEHAVLVTNWAERDVLAVAQIYRDRAGAENLFDELKNQWGWTGFTTQDLKRSQLMARIVALIYNWWSIFTRMATGASHGEAITTRPLLQHAVARRTRHANQTRLHISSLHGKAKMVANLLSRISSWLKLFQESAEQLDERCRAA